MPSPTGAERVRFGIFEADLRSGELYKQGRRIKLHQQPFQVLAMLLEHPGEVVTREELQRKLWPSDTFVNFDIGLNSAVRKLRRALHDSAEGPRYVETLARRGYRFIAPVVTVATSEARSGAEVSGPELEESVQSAFEGAADHTASRAAYRWIRWLVAGAALVLLIFLAWFTVGNWRQGSVAGAAAAPIRSIAVLPLDNQTGDPAQEYFVDSMTDALITNLAQISSLKVISRTSVMSYKGTRKRLPEIARELDVDGIVEGAVIRSGDRVRVDAQLVEAATDRHSWAQTYERNLGEVISLQGEIARAIANEIQVKLTPQEQVRLAARPSVDPQAYELYLKGRYLWDKWTDASSRKSIEYFQQAIQRAPDFALAYAGLANAYIERGDLPPAEAYPRAKAAARTALQLDENLAEAHTALAMSLYSYDWDWAGAEREFQRAIALNPNYALAHQWYGLFQRGIGRDQNWATEVTHARELEPVTLALSGDHVAIDRGQYDLAIEMERKKLELDPNSAGAYLTLGWVYRLKGMYEEAIVQIQKGINLSGGDPGALSALGRTYAAAGERDKALEIVQQLTVLSKHRYVRPSLIAVIYVGLDEKDLAFVWLQKAVADRSIPVGLRNREWASLRSDRRYSELLRRIGLP